MIKVANILPTKYLLPLESNNQSDIHILLAHRVLVDKEYVSYYNKRQKQGDFLILDNSAFELGSSLSLDLLTKAIVLCNPDEFVLPDVLKNKQETIKRSIKFLSEFKNKDYMRFMAVPQGKNIEEWVTCYEYFAQNKDINTIGIGAIYASDIFGNREKTKKYVSGRDYLIDQISQLGVLNKLKPHHLLGLSDSGHLELSELSKYEWIRSCDTSAAFVHGKKGKVFIKDQPYKKEISKIDFGQDFEDSNIRLVINNMEVLRESGKRFS